MLSDWLSGINSQLPLPTPFGETDVFDERDGRPALYVGGSVGDPWKIGKLRVGYFDNLGDSTCKGVWETRYGVVGVALQPLPGLDILFQYLIGKTDVAHARARAAPFRRSTRSSPTAGASTASRFATTTSRSRTTSGPPPNTRERGHAFTVGYLFEFWLRHRVGFEYITVDSDRVGVSDPGDDGWQVSYRFRY